MSIQIATIELPPPARYTSIQKQFTVTHVGLNGQVRRDLRANTSGTVYYQVQIGWEGLIEEERNWVMWAWGYLIEHSSANFVDPIGGVYTARLPAKDRTFRFAAYDGPNKTSGEIMALYDITVTVELHEVS